MTLNVSNENKTKKTEETQNTLNAFWSLPVEHALQQLNSTLNGITSSDAQSRNAKFAKNSLKQKNGSPTMVLLFNQFSSPIILILIAAAVLSFFLRDTVDASIILVIIAVSGLLGFWQERGAADAIQQLLAKVEIKAMVFRDGKVGEIAVHQVVPGDVIQVSAGDNIPGDCLLIESQTLFLDEATLTGETFPASKNAGILPSDTSLSQRSNFLFMGTHVVSGSARALVCSTGTATEFGKISDKLKFRPPETEFELGIRKFGYLLLEITLLLGMSIFACNVYLHRPVLDSFLFALALAVGLTPQLLPAIISINLAHGAKQMANMFVIVKRLPAIENFGCMNVLCSDKTGTLTDGQVHIQMALSINGSESEKVLFYAYLNASAETGYVILRSTPNGRNLTLPFHV